MDKFWKRSDEYKSLGGKVMSSEKNDSKTVPDSMSSSSAKPEKQVKDGFFRKVGKSSGSSRKNINYNDATVIKPKVVIRGDITGDQDLVIEGQVNGRIILKGDLFVAPTGLVEADVDARNVYIAGKINGNVYASQKIEIESSGILNGDIKCPKVIVTEGAVLRGNLDMNYEGLEMAKDKISHKKTFDDVIKLGPIRPSKPITLEDGKL